MKPAIYGENDFDSKNVSAETFSHGKARQAQRREFALGAPDKLKAYAEHFEKAFMKGQAAAAALFSPGR